MIIQIKDGKRIIEEVEIEGECTDIATTHRTEDGEKVVVHLRLRKPKKARVVTKEGKELL